jgi:hypothetical protein
MYIYNFSFCNWLFVGEPVDSCGHASKVIFLVCEFVWLAHHKIKTHTHTLYIYIYIYIYGLSQNKKLCSISLWSRYMSLQRQNFRQRIWNKVEQLGEYMRAWEIHWKNDWEPGWNTLRRRKNHQIYLKKGKSQIVILDWNGQWFAYSVKNLEKFFSVKTIYSV